MHTTEYGSDIRLYIYITTISPQTLKYSMLHTDLHLCHDTLVIGGCNPVAWLLLLLMTLSTRLHTSRFWIYWFLQVSPVYGTVPQSTSAVV